MFSENIYNIDYNNIIISDPIKNSLIEQSLFYKLFYSKEYITFNGIFLLFKFENITMNKDKIIFNNYNENNKNTLEKIIMIEKNILEILKTKKNKIFKLKEIITNNNIKFNKSDIDNINDYNEFNELNDNLFILKLSGLWETNDNIGLTFKIIKLSKEFIL